MTTQIRAACPKCHQVYKAPSNVAGRNIQCKKCGASFVFSSDAAADLSAPVPGHSAAESVRLDATSSAEDQRPKRAVPPGSTKPLPETIGQFKVRKQLGQGTFGVVYLAYHSFLDIQVAVKMLRAEALSSAQAVERFLREAKLLAKMDHPNVLRVYDAGRHGEDYYIAADFIPGNDLAEVIPDGGMEPRRAAKLVIQMLRALGYAHGRGIVHRDVKPANARLRADDTLVLMDFGLAGLTVREQSSTGDFKSQMRLTQAGAVMGTPAYMAPEQASGMTEQVGPEADLYSVGVVLYELLTGQLPFEAANLPALLYAVVHAEPTPPTQLRSDLDPELEAICLKALAKQPQQRYRSAEEFEMALEEWLCNQPSPTGGSPPAAPFSVLAAATQINPPAEVVATVTEIDAPAEVLATVARPAGSTQESSTTAPSRNPLLIGIIVGLVALVLFGGGLFWILGKAKRGAEPTRPGFFQDRDKYKH